jgi:hypothetical protein
MARNIRLHDVVALMEDVAATHFRTREPLQLRRRQIGTLVMLLEGRKAGSGVEKREERAQS